MACHDERVSERFSFRLPAGEPGCPAVYTPAAARSLINQPFLVNQGAREPRGGRIVAAEVIEEGAAVMVTVEVPAGMLTGFRASGGP